MSIINIVAEINQITESNIISNFAPIILMFIFLYFIMIRPQIKKQKEHKSLISSIEIDDEIVTIGGIIGKVRDIKNQYFIVEISHNLDGKYNIVLQKDAIVSMLPKNTMKQI
ncbi:hypothetical protein CKSOR_00122 [Candidatus Kinetoplastibacterium sorsogonicusi]|uniref:Sec translocon accessory complex subunit YajC n=1 Tax=Candidatus Kinetoplastidibacterium kentomonadis TaxID=1576550 RepID=A0A3Q8EXZ8_9PROT|nr:preprotein translocase subunit YajC [Candidatus Kinetoplastibacterium sorsogonicusi]AWD32258.1 hypothetical protein CKSOR_00122 [Candidatus Kinetoplastibacterium sorsogonicusi]